MAGRSDVWNYFSEVKGNPNRAICNFCNNEYSCKSGTTSSLINHLKSKHKEVHDKYLANSKKRPTSSADSSLHQQPRAKQAKLQDCFPVSGEVLNKKVDDAMVDVLVDSGVAFRVVGFDSFKKFVASCFNPKIKSKHRTTKSKLVREKAEKIRSDLINIVNTAKVDQNCIAFTTDMWICRAGDPFM